MNKRNRVVDMIFATMMHAKRYNRQIKEITLAPSRWKLFKEHLEERGLEVDDIVEFNNLIVKKGSIFMVNYLKIVYAEPNKS